MVKTKLFSAVAGLASLLFAAGLNASVAVGSNGVGPTAVPEGGATIALACVAAVGLGLFLRGRAKK